MSTKDINLKALFIGDKSENGDMFKNFLVKLVDQHLGWRYNYMPQDEAMISHEDKESESFKNTVTRMEDVLEEVSIRLRTNSVPWHSAGRYWGHMNAETLMPAILAYDFAMLWNGNNVAYESSPGTSQMEEEVGHDFATLLGFKEGWGHIVADGSLANLEGLWYARNMKSIPLAVKKVAPEFVEGKSEWELLNMSAEDAMAILKKMNVEQIDAVKAASARNGKDLQKLGKWLVPQSKHYSWPKAADIIGIGLDQVVPIPLKDNYRMDVAELEKTIRKLTAEKTPILGVVAVVGTTEEGAIDEVDKIVALREKLKNEGIYFYLHVDAAYAGYMRALVLDEENQVIPYDQMAAKCKEYGVFQDHDMLLSKEVYNALVAIKDAESVTIDPHKMGYIPYAAGGIAIRDVYMREIISYFATYVFERGADIPALLGAYMLEGSKAGATGAAVWAAHRVLPLNIAGYGKLIGASMEGARNFYDFLNGLGKFQVGDKTVSIHTLINPDFNMVDYVFKVDGDDSLTAMNDLNNEFYKLSSFNSGCLYYNEYIISHTDFAVEGYGDSPVNFVHNTCGLSLKEWEKAKKVVILRACVLSPYMNVKEAFDEFAADIKKIFQKRLEQILLK